MLADGRGHVHHLLAIGPVDLDEYRRMVLMPDDQVGFLETVADLGDIAKAQDRAVTTAEKDDLLEVLLVVVLAEGADPHLGFPGIDTAGR